MKEENNTSSHLIIGTIGIVGYGRRNIPLSVIKGEFKPLLNDDLTLDINSCIMENGLETDKSEAFYKKILKKRRKK